MKWISRSVLCLSLLAVGAAMAGVADSRVQPLIGYRPRCMWAFVPVSDPAWTLQTYLVHVAEAAKTMSVDGWKSRSSTGLARC